MSTKIIGVPQNYAWGKVGSTSAVARYEALNNPDDTIDESKPYAELWMGTHPKAPATFKAAPHGQLLSLIETSPSKYLGSSVVAKFGDSGLPFLFKVLSINDVLSIQAHPDKKLGAQLHASDPAHYPDSNHKPEMAIAITDFEAFCGFKPLEEIDDLLQKIPEFHELIGDKVAAEFHAGVNDATVSAANKKLLLKSVFSQLMNADEKTVAVYAGKMVSRIDSDPELFGADLADLIPRLNKQFPGDVGLFGGCLMLNHCFLKSGEAMFMQALAPHAYIYGDIMECMATSDNVIRAGFTPKFKDVNTLVSCLTYATDPVAEQKLKPAAFPRGTGEAKFALYDPPIDEFSVLQIKCTGNAHIGAIDGPSIMIVTDGKGQVDGDSAGEGSIFYIAPGHEVELSGEFTLYRAYCEA